jgi:2-hydroxychromene-2-carboxylate isomerase
VSLAEDDAAKSALRANTDRAIAQGVFGVPSFVVPITSSDPAASGHEVFWGVDAFDMLLAWLDDPACLSASPSGILMM